MEKERLEQAIHHAVAAIAAPDEARLAAILARLEQVPASRPAPRRTVWPWLLLAAAGAAAAGGGYWYAQKTARPSQAVDTGRHNTETLAPAPISPPSSLPAGTEAENENTVRQRNAPIIYRQ